jgi:hypothetical protein
MVIYNKIKFYLQRIYRLSLSYKNKEELVWKELKRLHNKSNWKSGIYENEKHIETSFEISQNQGCIFYYMIYDGSFHCRVKILENYPSELTTDLFILASHFNNLLNNGIVIVNVSNQFVEYHQKRELLIPLLYNSEIYDQLIRHYNTSKDIYSAFQRLIIEQEPPAIIIADLLKSKENKDHDSM